MQPDILIFLAILIFSVVLHEIAHGYMALYFGDPTARLAGRLTLNPRSHIDPMGSLVVPGLLLLGSGGGFAFGWAKPVPYNPYNLSNFKWGTIAVGLAGVAVNFLLALIFGLLIRFSLGTDLFSPDFIKVLFMVMQVNIILGVFNLIPIPPLDGSKVLFALLPQKWAYIQDFMEQNWLIFLVAVFFIAYNIISPAFIAIASLIIGVPLNSLL